MALIPLMALVLISVGQKFSSGSFHFNSHIEPGPEKIIAFKEISLYSPFVFQILQFYFGNTFSYHPIIFAHVPVFSRPQLYTFADVAICFYQVAFIAFQLDYINIL